MRSKLYALLLLSSLFITDVLYSQTVTGTYTLPGLVNSTTVNNLTQLAAVLNSGTVSGTAIFEFTSAYTSTSETYPIVFNQFGGTGNVIIRPAASVTTPLITAGAPANTALVSLYSASNITFDGQPGGTGGAIKWMFQNTGSASSYPTFRFVNGASTNVLQYLAIQSSTSAFSATILFDTSHVAGGNSGNIIQYDSIGNYNALPYNAILSAGKAGKANAHNFILHNNIYNLQGYYGGFPTSGGVVIAPTGNGSGWNISNNSFYSTVTTPEGTAFLTPIYFGADTGSAGNVISGNYIGGKAPHCGTAGDPWIFDGFRGYTTYNDFTGIYVTADTTATTIVANNVVSNIKLFSNGDGSQTFCGIHVGGKGKINVTGNTVGSDSTINSIYVGTAGVMVGIWNESSGAVMIDRNTVANLTSDFSAQPIGETYANGVGIYCYPDYNLTKPLGANTITNNNIHHIAIADNYNLNQYFPLSSGGCGTGTYACIDPMHVLTGIFIQATGTADQTISKNIVHDLKDTVNGGSSKVYVDGITAFCGSGINTINGNKVYGLWTNDGFSTTIYGSFSGLTGIYLPSGGVGRYFVTNNDIQLGTKPTDGSSVINCVVTGIWDNNANNNIATLKNYVYHNSVYLSGTDNNSHNVNRNTFAFRRDVTFTSTGYDSLTVYNNIFVNNRSTTAGTGQNFGIYLNDTKDVSSDYNLVYGTGTGYRFGSALGVAISTLDSFNTVNTGFETHSIAADPLFLSPNTLTPDLHVNLGSPVDMAGTASYTITYDFDSLPRSSFSPVDIGASVIGGCPTNIGVTYLTDSICNNGSYSFNGNTIYVPGTYNDTIAGMGGCDSSVTVLNLTATVSPYITQVGSSDSLLIEGLFEQYQWLLNDTTITAANTNIYVAVQDGNYTVVVTHIGGCIDTSLVYHFVHTGIKDVPGEPEVSVYPNPTTTSGWQLLTSNDLTGSQLDIYNESGQIVYTSRIRNAHTNIQINTASGIYWLRISSATATVMRKLIKL